MNCLVVILADRVVRPLRENSEQALVTSIERASETLRLCGNRWPLYVLLGFRREEIIRNFFDGLFINNPHPSSHRIPNSFAHCLQFLPLETKILFWESGTPLCEETLNVLAELAESTIATVQGAFSTTEETALLVHQQDRDFFEKMVRDYPTDQGEFLGQLATRFARRNLSAVQATRAGAPPVECSAKYTFDQQ